MKGQWLQMNKHNKHTRHRPTPALRQAGAMTVLSHSSQPPNRADERFKNNTSLLTFEHDHDEAVVADADERAQQTQTPPALLDQLRCSHKVNMSSLKSQ
jgi:hypothetical protein